MERLTDTLCRWDAPGGGGSVFLSVSTVRELRNKAIEAFLSLPRRGVEIGGLLFGRVRDGHIFIQRAEEVTCEHRFGPSFVLSDEDQTRLEARLEQAKHDGSLPVIGFYRSYTGRKAEIEDAEIELLRRHCPMGEFVFLLLQPITAQKCTAGFRLCRDGEVLADPPYAPVPFEAAEMGGGPEEAAAEPVAVEPAPAEVVPPPVADPAHVETPRLPPPYRAMARHAVEPAPTVDEAPARTRWWLPIVICLLGGIGGAFLYELWTLARQPRWAELHLDAKPSIDARSLIITWDTAAAKATGATHALLGITDGAAHRDVQLSLAQVQLGRYAYAPAHDDLDIRLILYGNGPAVTGSSLRLAPSPRAPAQAAPNRQAAAPAPAPAVRQTAPVREVQPRISEGIRARIRGAIVIPIEVQIDGDGRVTNASASSYGDALHQYLANEAVKAAEQWRFTPTGGDTLKTINFRFTR